MRARRDLVTVDEAHAAARAVASRGLEWTRARFAPGAAAAAYWPIRSELSPVPLLEALAAAGFRTALPRMKSATRVLSFHVWAPGDALVKGPLGLSEPAADAAALDPAILFLPLLAFDAAGGRLGYGGGHYDATLAQARAQGAVAAVGLAYDLQEAVGLPIEPHDAALDAVLTETRLLSFRS